MEQLERLNRTVDDLSKQAREIRREMHQRTRVFIAFTSIGAILLVVAICAAFVVSLNNQRAIEANNRRWCPVLAAFIPKPGESLPTTPRGLQTVENISAIARDFGCIK